MKPGPVPGQVFAARETLAVDYRLVISVEFESKCSTIKTSNLEKRYQNSLASVPMLKEMHVRVALAAD